MNLKLVLFASVSVSLAAAAGCVVTPSDSLGGSGGSGSGASVAVTSSSSSMANNDSPARQYYVMNVHPLLTQGAQPCSSCHATGTLSAPVFLDADAELAYGKIEAMPGLIALPANSLLIQHGLHTGPALTQTQKDMVTSWLHMEAMERGLDGATTGSSSASSSASSSSSGGGTGMPMDLASALDMFGKCMSPTEWKNNGLDQIYKINTNNNQGQCQSCHITGDGGNYLSNDLQTTFAKQQVFPFIKRWVSGTYDKDGNFTGLKAVPREYLKADEAAKCDKAKEACHPTFTMPDTLKAGVDKFISTTLTNMKNNACP